MNATEHIIVDDKLTSVNSELVAGFVCHAFCQKGSCTFTYNAGIIASKRGAV